jgi:preprotein translocase subunit SecY
MASPSASRARGQCRHRSRLFFRISTVITLTGGTMFLMWLGEQITSRGIGNGISLIIFAGIVAGLPQRHRGRSSWPHRRDLDRPDPRHLLLIALAAWSSLHRVHGARPAPPADPVSQAPGRQQDVPGRQSSHLPLKLNTSGVIPPIFASSLLLLPTTVANFNARAGAGVAAVADHALLGHGQPLYLILYAALIIFFAFFYTSIVFNPTETADNLKKYGGFIPGIRPGERTAEYIDYVLTRITVSARPTSRSSACCPEFLIGYTGVPFYFGGTSLLIVVSVTMDTVAQVQGHLLAHQYEGLIKKSKLRGRVN